MTNLRLFFVGGLLAYRALFRWLKPSVFIPTLIGVPAFQILFFVLLGRYAGGQPDSFYAIGNALHSTAVAGLFAASMCVTSERAIGTLSGLFATPASKALVYGGRALPPVLTAITISLLMLLFSWLALGVTIPGRVMPVLALAIAGCAASTSAFGLLLGAIGLRIRDVTFLSNLVLYLTLLVSGANVPVEKLPAPLAAIGQALPMTHGIAGVRCAMDGCAGSPATQLLLEWLLAMAYLVMALVGLKALETSSRRHATLDRA